MNLKYKPEQYLWGLFTSLSCLVIAIILAFWSPLWLIPTVFIYVLMAVANSAGLHRLFAHRAYRTTPFWDGLLLVACTMSCYGSTFQWTIAHTQHHKFPDTTKDPYKLAKVTDLFSTDYGVGTVTFSNKRYIRHLLDKPSHRWVHNHYWLLPLGLLIVLSLISIKVALYFYLAPLGLIFLSDLLFNYFAHDDAGPNNRLIHALIPNGEWRHKAHHQRPWQWDLREKWYHIDLPALFIRAIKI